MWHLLARSGLSERPDKQVPVYLIHSVLMTSCPVEVKQLTQRGRGVTRLYEEMSHAAVRMRERGSFGHKYASALMMTNPSVNNRRNQLINWLSLQTKVECRTIRRNGPIQRSHRKLSPSSAVETSQSSINAHTNKYQYVGQSLTKAKLLKGTAQKCCTRHTT